MSGRVDAVLDGGAVHGGLPSTIVEIGEHGPTLVRAGAIAWDRVLKSLQ
jgi:tRNA A37 threonylcarbamoyladenosine synthetase subunit TsaC/SUA5/YrdC